MGEHFQKCIFAKNLGWGSKFGQFLVPPDFDQKCTFLYSGPQRDPGGDPGGRSSRKPIMKDTWKAPVRTAFAKRTRCPNFDDHRAACVFIY